MGLLAACKGQTQGDVHHRLLTRIDTQSGQPTMVRATQVGRVRRDTIGAVELEITAARRGDRYGLVATCRVRGRG